MKRNLLLVPCLLAAALGPGCAWAAEHYDVLIRGATVIDGTGRAGYRADVAVRGDRIVLVGRAGRATAATTVDARGRVLAPGFIDAHSHIPDVMLDMRLSARPGPVSNAANVAQGVTTIVGGPDGHLSAKDIANAGKRLAERGITSNFAFYVGHNGIRREVMGYEQRAPTPDELDRMREQVREGMRHGALGLSTGLMYPPGMYSKTDEVIQLAREVKPLGGVYDSHVRSPVFGLLESDVEAITIGREAGIPVKITHEKAPGRRNFGKSAGIIAMVEAARARGEDVVIDQYPYDGAATIMLADLIIDPEVPQAEDAEPPPPAEVLALVQRLLADATRLPVIRDATENGVKGGFSWTKAVGYGSMRIVASTDYPSLVGKNLEVLAAERGMEPFDLLVQLLRESKTPTMITLADLAETDLRALLVQRWNMIASDGGYLDDQVSVIDHPRSTGSFTRVLGHYSRDLKLLTLPEAVRKMTSLPADFLHLQDRGRIAVGKFADIVIFDPASVRDESTWTEPRKLSTGVSDVIVNGVFVRRNGSDTGAQPGRFVARQGTQ